jgi:hypothetical protein
LQASAAIKTFQLAAEDEELLALMALLMDMDGQGVGFTVSFTTSRFAARA